MSKNLIKFLILILCFMTLSGCAKMHIEDTNGDEDFTLCTIKDEDILKSSYKVYEVKSQISSKNNVILYSSNMLSGIKEVKNLRLNESVKTVYVNLIVEKGNALFVIRNSKGIVHRLNANESNSFKLPNDSDLYKLILVGESAKFELKIEIK